MDKVYRSIALSSSILFSAFAALQWNDPDPWLWIFIYGFAAFLCWSCHRGRLPMTAVRICIGGCILYGAFLFFDKDGVASWIYEHRAESIVQTMKAEKPWIEKTREFGGLAIVVAVLSYLSSGFNRSKRDAPGDPAE